MTPASVARGRELPRKTLHLTTAVVPVGLWLGVPQPLVATLLTALFGVACLVELTRRRSPAFASRFSSSVGAMLRPHEVTHGITGATWLLGAFAITVLAAPRQAAIAATWAGAVGDASAAIVGSQWRLRRGGSGKTVVGSLSCAVASAVGAWWLAGFSVPLAAFLGCVATAVERPTMRLDDNVRVTVAVAFAAAAMLRL
jgi:dolichol kinase